MTKGKWPESVLNLTAVVVAVMRVSMAKVSISGAAGLADRRRECSRVNIDRHPHSLVARERQKERRAVH